MSDDDDAEFFADFIRRRRAQEREEEEELEAVAAMGVALCVRKKKREQEERDHLYAEHHAYRGGKRWRPQVDFSKRYITVAGKEGSFYSFNKLLPEKEWKEQYRVPKNIFERLVHDLKDLIVPNEGGAHRREDSVTAGNKTRLLFFI